jgi:hypothetical protein
MGRKRKLKAARNTDNRKTKKPRIQEEDRDLYGDLDKQYQLFKVSQNDGFLIPLEKKAASEDEWVTLRFSQDIPMQCLPEIEEAPSSTDIQADATPAQTRADDELERKSPERNTFFYHPPTEEEMDAIIESWLVSSPGKK